MGIPTSISREAKRVIDSVRKDLGPTIGSMINDSLDSGRGEWLTNDGDYAITVLGVDSDTGDIDACVYLGEDGDGYTLNFTIKVSAKLELIDVTKDGE